MKTILVILLLGGLIVPVAAFSGAGYKRSAWGSKTWTGPGTPPHWSSHPSSSHRPVDPEWGVKPPHHKPGRRSRVYYQRPVVETEVIVIEQKSQVKVLAPAIKHLSPQRCGGETLTRKDPLTGEIVIEYTTSSRQCPE